MLGPPGRKIRDGNEDATHRQLQTVIELLLCTRHCANYSIGTGSRDLPQSHEADPVIISKVPNGKSEADHVNDLPEILSKHESGFTPRLVGLLDLKL